MKFMNECLRVYRRTTKTFLVGQNWVDSLDKRTFFKYWNHINTLALKIYKTAVHILTKEDE